MPSDYILQNEATAAMRSMTLPILSAGGAHVAGVSLGGGTPAVLKIAKQGGNFGASAGATLTEITGFVEKGEYNLAFAAGDVDTVGDLRGELSSGTGPAFPTILFGIPIRPATRSVDVADGFLTTAKIVDNFLTSAKLTDGLLVTAKFADAFLTNAKIADGLLTTAKLADNLLTSAKLTDGLLTSAKFADAFLTAAKVADAFITASKFATDSITADALKADAGTEIGAAVWAALLSANHAAGSMGEKIMLLMMAARINCVVDQIVNGTVPGIITASRVRHWIDKASVPAVSGHANDADGEDARATETATDAAGGLWSDLFIKQTKP